MRIKAKYHYGNTRYESTMSLSEFLHAMRNAIGEMPGNEGREQAVFACLQGLIVEARGEFGWTTYTLEDN